jgi:hypothetical protein
MATNTLNEGAGVVLSQGEVVKDRPIACAI